MTGVTTLTSENARFESRFDSLNRGKANFDEIYDAPDPRDYLRVLGGLDYVIPDLAKGILRSLIVRCAKERGRRIKVLDVGCSYGINAALTRFPLDMQRLMRRYNNAPMQGLPSEALRRLDMHYFASWPEQVDADFFGLDLSAPAISYAKNVGLIADGASANLEEGPPSEAEAAMLRDIDLIVSTGCVGYVTERSFRHLMALQHKDNPPWVASFVLRMFPYDAIAQELARHGLMTEKLRGVTFVQRRFHSGDECESTLRSLKSVDVDPAGKEADGLLHAELFVSRPEAALRANPLASIVSVTSGENRRYGRRYRQGRGRQVLM